jgi:hypothetical protein
MIRVYRSENADFRIAGVGGNTPRRNANTAPGRRE